MFGVFWLSARGPVLLDKYESRDEAMARLKWEVAVDMQMNFGDTATLYFIEEV